VCCSKDKVFQAEDKYSDGFPMGDESARRHGGRGVSVVGTCGLCACMQDTGGGGWRGGQHAGWGCERGVACLGLSRAPQQRVPAQCYLPPRPAPAVSRPPPPPNPRDTSAPPGIYWLPVHAVVHASTYKHNIWSAICSVHVATPSWVGHL
jgi:hypothetical protein